MGRFTPDNPWGGKYCARRCRMDLGQHGIEYVGREAWTFYQSDPDGQEGDEALYWINRDQYGFIVSFSPETPQVNDLNAQG